MEFQLYKLILQGELSPLQFKFPAANLLRQKLSTSFLQPQTISEFKHNTSNFPGVPQDIFNDGLQIYEAHLNIPDSFAIFKTQVDFPIPNSAITKFYHNLISFENKRILTTLLAIHDSKLPTEVKHTWLTESYEKIQHLLDVIGSSRHYFVNKPDAKYTIELLQNELVKLLFEMQHQFGEQHDLYFFSLDEVCSEILHVPRSSINLITINLNDAPKSLDSVDNALYKGPRKLIEEHLGFFKLKNLSGERILSEKKFDVLIMLVDQLIISKKCPQITEAISINLKFTFIRYTFYLLYKNLPETPRTNDEWINFIKTGIHQSKDSSLSTIKKKFSDKPPYYHEDLKKINGEFGEVSSPSVHH